MISKKRKKRKKKSHYHRGEYTSTKSCELYKFRSGWEEKVMIYLDSNPDVETWSYEKITIEYTSNARTKKIRKYYPDFFVKYVDGRMEILEVKPKKRLQQAAVKKKATAAELWCSSHGMTYKVLTEIELKDIGIL